LPWDRGKPPDEETHRFVFFEIMSQLIEHVEAALNERDDVWKPIRIMVQADRLIEEYTIEGFVYLLPLQQRLQRAIYTACRMARRAFYRRALTCPPNEVAKYQADLQAGFLWDEKAEEDFAAAERHLADGTRLMDGLWRKTQARQ
jgi:hypothetical protein